MILKKPTLLIVILSLVMTVVFAMPQTALAAVEPPACPEGYSLIAKYEWNDGDGWVFEKYWDVVTITGDSYYGTWDSGTIAIELVHIKDGNTPDGEVIQAYYGPWSPGVTSGYYDASEMVPDPTHNISYIAFCGDTFPVSLASFNAQATRGNVAIHWVTATEINTAGFILYRSTTIDGTRTQITNLIAAHGNEVTGASYSVTDSPGYGTFYYWLEDVDYSGQSGLYGPVVAKVLPAIRLPVVRPSLPGQ